MEWVELAKLAVRARYAFSIWLVCLVLLIAPLPDFILERAGPGGI